MVFGQTSHEGEGVLAGRPGVIAAFGLSSQDNWVLTALPVDMQLGDAVFGVDGDHKVVDYGPEQVARRTDVPWLPMGHHFAPRLAPRLAPPFEPLFELLRT